MEPISQVVAETFLVWVPSLAIIELQILENHEDIN